MDAIDFKILELLQTDGRMPMRRLAEQINMSTPATIERVRKLEERQSIVGYKAIVRPDRVGHEVGAFVLVAVDREYRDKFYQYVQTSNSVVEAYELAGRYTAVLHLSCPDMEEFLKTVYDLYKMGSSESYVITDLLKSGIYRRGTEVIEGTDRTVYSPGREVNSD